MKPDTNDIIVLTGLIMMDVGVYFVYGWEIVLVVLGSLITIIGVWRSK